jgi:predicted TIM-barrel fold metal-dependent hydrolase
VPLARAGVLDANPSIKFVVAHADCAWVPSLIEQVDAAPRGGLPDPLPNEAWVPSDYVRHHTWYTFQHDRAGVLNRDVIGTSHLMWASHLPLPGCDWPEDRGRAELTTAGLPDDERHKLLAENCAKLYRLPGSEAGFSDAEVSDYSAPLQLI